MTSSGAAHAYRPDIDGLRAIAVLAVLAYHAYPETATGGLVGVDLFFVISGFLITGIVLDDLRHGRFSFGQFYWRRARRIFPALVLVLATTVALGWQLLLPDEFAELGKHVAAATAFCANFTLWRETGYFSAAADLKPLLHLWSLGIEEQYYAVWPLVLYLFHTRPRVMAAMIVGMGVTSFAMNVVMVTHHPSAAFYLPVTRFWELLSGSLLACLARYRSQGTVAADFQAFSGLALVVATLLFLDGDRDFPGWWAVAPVLGAALLISAGPAAWVNRTILSRRELVFVGLISYPLYLWHWPLLAYARVTQGDTLPITTVAGTLLSSFLLAWVTFELIEKRIRFAWNDVRLQRRAMPALIACMTAVGAVGVAASMNLVEPRSASVPQVSEISRARADWEVGGDRVIPGDTNETVLFFGDSHMQQYWPRVEKLVDEHRTPVRRVIFKTRNGCAPVPGIENKTGRCASFVADGFRLALEPEIETVVVAAHWVGMITTSAYYSVDDPQRSPLRILAPDDRWVIDGFAAALRNLQAHGKQVVIVLSSPQGDTFNPMSAIHREDLTVRVVHASSGVSRQQLVAKAAPIDDWLKRIAAAIGAVVVDPADWLCTPLHCPTIDLPGRPLYKDGSHLRASAAREHFRALDHYVILDNRSASVSESGE